MEIAGRHNEKRILDWQHERNGSQFIAIYGRRRVGKTFLIRKHYADEIIFSCTGLKDGSKREQLDNFYAEIIRQSKLKVLPPSNWMEAFEILKQHISKTKTKKNKKKVVFIDEIPWMDTKRAGFMTAFTAFWNDYCDIRDDLIVVICGSAATWIINKVVKTRGGLHNRITQSINLQPFDLSETKEMLSNQKVHLSSKDLTQLYMCVGGIPYYLSHVKRGRSVPQILDDLYLNKNAALKDEFSNLYESLFDNYEDHNKITKALSGKNKGLSRKEIIAATALPSGGGLSTTLEELIKCGFITETSDADKAKSGKLFRLSDEYTIFYYKFLHSKSKLNSGVHLYNSHKFKIWAGFAFENFCIKNHKLIAKAMGITGIAYKVSSFIDRGAEESTGAQIDLIIDRDDNVINIFEIKWRDSKYTMSKKEAQNLQNKISSFRRKTKTKKSIFATLITSHGSQKNIHYLEMVTKELTLDELMN